SGRPPTRPRGPTPACAPSSPTGGRPSPGPSAAARSAADPPPTAALVASNNGAFAAVPTGRERTVVRRRGPGSALSAVDRRDDRLERGGRDRRVDADSPEHVVAHQALDVGGGGRVAAGGQRVLGVVQHLDADTTEPERLD